MPKPFSLLDLEAFENLVDLFPFTRKINAVHLHHTWRPTRDQFRGLDTIEGMYRYHTETNGWSDIAQHLTIDPEGGIWTGRNWNHKPASASGFNGTRTHGPFMIEMIGNFDEGPLDGPQQQTVIQVLAILHRKFGLHPQQLCFHNQLSGKTCPGTSVNRDGVVTEVTKAMKTTARRESQPRSARPFSDEMLQSRQHAESALRALTSGPDVVDEPPTAEPLETVDARTFGLDQDQVRGDGRLTLSPEILDELRPHIINLEQGDFSDDGLIGTSPEDVDAIFGENLPRWRDAHPDQPLRIVLFAHGGLVSEGAGLRIAYKHVQWWKDNGIYPIYFVWETGLGETISQLLSAAFSRIRAPKARDIFDYTSDRLIERLARALGGRMIWSGMKQSAELASKRGGGAYYTADKLRRFCKDETDAGREVEIHAVGHSAGSIFHSHLLPKIIRNNGPKIRSLHFLAPAVRVDTFDELLEDEIGKGVEHLTMFTMKKSYEKADSASPVYRKSLLYLVSRALETRRKTPILGLEVSVRKDAKMSKLFGLGGHTADAAEIVWSKSAADEGRNASQSTTHGGFDDDVATMNSVVRRVLDVGDTDPIKEYKPAGERFWGAPTLADLIGDLDEFDWLPQPAPAVTPPTSPTYATWPPITEVKVPIGATQPGVEEIPVQGARRALCVGIDDYPTAPLYGCVADARNWGANLQLLNFDVRYLIDADATQQRILDELRTLITSASPGDVVVFQYAGHGTRLQDLNGDEQDDKDEALVPHDYNDGAYVLDDDLGVVFDLIPTGVNLTCFMDCCHSGTITRVAPPDAPQARALRVGHSYQRFMPSTEQMRQAHAMFRQARGMRSGGKRTLKKEIAFSACQDYQSAYETDGQGDFTRNVAGLLTDAVQSRWSHDDFQSRIDDTFRGVTRQKPRLTCPPGWLNRVTLTAYRTGQRAEVPIMPPMSTEAILRQLLDRLQQGR